MRLPSGGVLEAITDAMLGFAGEYVTITGEVSEFRRTHSGERVTVLRAAMIATGEL